MDSEIWVKRMLMSGRKGYVGGGSFVGVGLNVAICMPEGSFDEGETVGGEELSPVVVRL